VEDRTRRTVLAGPRPGRCGDADRGRVALGSAVGRQSGRGFVGSGEARTLIRGLRVLRAVAAGYYSPWVFY
jgi:hypothetical protein